MVLAGVTAAITASLRRKANDDGAAREVVSSGSLTPRTLAHLEEELDDPEAGDKHEENRQHRSQHQQQEQYGGPHTTASQIWLLNRDDSHNLSSYRTRSFIKESSGGLPVDARFAFIESHVANMLIGGVILANAILVGVETQFRRDFVTGSGSEDGVDDPTSLFWSPWFWADMAFLLFFSVEIVIRFAYYRWGFFLSALNVFDLLLLVSSFIELIMILIIEAQGGGASSRVRYTGFLTALRVARLVRLARILRVVRFFRELYVLTRGLVNASRALVWVSLLLLLVIYVGAVFTTRNLGQRYGDADAEWRTDEQKLDEWFGNMLRSIFTLFQVLTLEGWSEIARTSMKFEDWSGLFFVLFLIFTNISLLNLVTGVIVDNILEISRHHNETKHLERASKEKLQNIERLLQIFKLADVDKDHEVTREEFQQALTKDAVIRKLNAEDIAVVDAQDLWEFLDHEGTGALRVKDFIEGCLRIKGSAKSVKLVQYGLHKMAKGLHRRIDCLEMGFRSEIANVLLSMSSHYEERLSQIMTADHTAPDTPGPSPAPWSSSSRKRTKQHCGSGSTLAELSDTHQPEEEVANQPTGQGPHPSPDFRRRTLRHRDIEGPRPPIAGRGGVASFENVAELMRSAASQLSIADQLQGAKSMSRKRNMGSFASVGSSVSTNLAADLPMRSHSLRPQANRQSPSQSAAFAPRHHSIAPARGSSFRSQGSVESYSSFIGGGGGDLPSRVPLVLPSPPHSGMLPAGPPGDTPQRPRSKEPSEADTAPAMNIPARTSVPGRSISEKPQQPQQSGRSWFGTPLLGRRTMMGKQSSGSVTKKQGKMVQSL
ncbi:unnamed protein product [Vitrella brassicaformis CCMP3155]|uniref:EF-hand domain-containing protein n=1 Tax=Vitrella brassicaformis (strain CCMP3155) TaxID=1169540 RepID=A0A0G4E9Y0_VITBC|nr:unnamed protein product [Vitrella brassicaformis CCMP3155]|eukprot:CEL92457.1 unnamed protein product [Vitrella brassicaformis CCMP3155]